MPYYYVKPIYSEEEIRKWKALIYGQSNLRVDEWVSSAQDTTPVRRTSIANKKRSTSAPRVNCHVENDWLGGSPSKARNYRVKGNSPVRFPTLSATLEGKVTFDRETT
eukprot:jgi/Psemu1/67947/estExt_Genemark1.C_4000031